MSDIMKSIPFPQLLTWVRTEYKEKGSVFGVHTPYIAQEEKALTLFGRKLELPLGPAAGPNSSPDRTHRALVMCTWVPRNGKRK